MLLSSFAAVLFAFATQGDKTFIVTSAFLFSLCTTPGWNALDVVSVESYPSTLRTGAVGVLASGGRLGSIIAQFVNGLLLEHVDLLLTVTSITMFIGSVSAYFLRSPTYN